MLRFQKLQVKVLEDAEPASTRVFLSLGVDLENKNIVEHHWLFSYGFCYCISSALVRSFNS